MRANLERVEEIAKDTRLFQFKLEKPSSFLPGQSFRLTLPNPTYQDSGGSSRFFSIANAMNQEGRVSTATRKGLSAFKRSLWELPLWAEVDISQIGGVFLLPKNTNSHFVFVAGGIGITPFISLLDYLMGHEPKAQVSLLYSNPDRESCAFLERLQKLELQNKRFRLVTVFTKQKGQRTDARLFKEVLKKPGKSLYYLAGPAYMVNGLFDELLKFGVSPDAIKTEEFTGY